MRMAWGIKLDGKNNLVVATVGDAATRQGDFSKRFVLQGKKIAAVVPRRRQRLRHQHPDKKSILLALDALQA